MREVLVEVSVNYISNYEVVILIYFILEVLVEVCKITVMLCRRCAK